MAIRYQVLGLPGRDNALLVTVDTGQSISRLLFDCGEGVLAKVPVADVQQIAGLFFSHFHFDHVAGFDSFFRLNWSRPDDPVRIFGPLGAREIIHHRLQGVTWNLVAGVPGEIHVTEMDAETLLQQFKVQHPAEYEVLLDTLESQEALDKNIKMLLLFHPGEVVWESMLNHAKVWEWSSEPSRFVEQFRTRYPAEFQKIEQEFSLEDQIKIASLPPKEVARNLRAFARGDLDIYAEKSASPGRSINVASEK